MGGFWKLSLYSVSSVVVLFVSVIASLLGSKDICSANEQCTCPQGFTWTWCHNGRCYGNRKDDRCRGQANGYKLGDGLWCWDEKAVTDCSMKQGPLEVLRNLIMFLLQRFLGQFGTALPSIPMMWWRPDDTITLVSGCAKFSELGWNVPESKEPLMRLGAIDVTVAALKRHRGNRKVEDACYNSLAALSLYNRPVSLRVGELGGVEMTADYWQRNFDDPKAVIANYFGCYQDFSHENRERMMQAGAVRMILEACGEGGRHFWDASAQFSCWCGFSSFHTKRNHEEFRRLGGMRHAYVAFRDHGQSYRVREEILQAMKGLCAYRANREDLVREGFVELLTGAIKTEKKDPQIQALGIETLRMFVDGNATLRASLVADGGVDLAFGALGLHAARLLDTRQGWDTQNVYGDLNDHQYNVPGGASELLYSLALDGPKTLEAMVAAGAIQKLDAAIEATQHRIPAVKWRTWLAACQVLRMLKEAAEGAGQEAERRRVLGLRGCQDRDQRPDVVSTDSDFEP